MKPSLTLEHLRSVVSELRKHAVPAHTVKTEQEAAALTRNDPLEHHWRVGDEYYRIDDLRGTVAAPDDTERKDRGMKLLTERQQIRDLPNAWRQQHGSGSFPLDKRGRQVGDELAALDVETATLEQVLEITDGRWVQQCSCGECGQVRWDIVELGEEPDYESATARICGDCLRAALKLLDDERKG